MFCKVCGAAVMGKYCSCCGARVRSDAEELRLMEGRMRRAFVNEKTDLRLSGRRGLAHGRIADACWCAATIMYPCFDMTVQEGRENLEKIDKYARYIFSLVIVAATQNFGE